MNSTSDSIDFKRLFQSLTWVSVMICLKSSMIMGSMGLARRLTVGCWGGPLVELNPPEDPKDPLEVVPFIW